jgi:peptide deformylase
VSAEVLPVLQVPSPILNCRSHEVSAFDGVEEIIASLLATMHSFPEAIGLAAPQVGITQRIIVIDHRVTEQGDWLLVNPIVQWTDGSDVKTEGCLSIKGAYIEVVRPKTVYVKAQDQFGASWEAETTGLLARVIQHEIDHLDGILITQRSNRGDVYGRELAPDRR